MKVKFNNWSTETDGSRNAVFIFKYGKTSGVKIFVVISYIHEGYIECETPIPKLPKKIKDAVQAWIDTKVIETGYENRVILK